MGHGKPTLSSSCDPTVAASATMTRLAYRVQAAVVLLLLLAALFPAPVPVTAHEAARILGFWRVDPRTGAWTASLGRGSVINLSDGPVAIVALPSSGRAHSVVWTSPRKWAHRERFAPFSMAGDFGGRFRAAALQPGMLRLAAYVDDGNGRLSRQRKKVLTVMVVPE